MLWIRVLSAVIGAPLLLLVIYAGGWLLTAAVSLLSIVGWGEFYRLAKKAGLNPWRWLGWMGVLAWPVSAYLFTRGMSGPLLHLNIFLLVATAVGFIVYYPERELGDSAVTFWGLLYVGGLLSHLILLRETPQGLFWVLLALVVTWSNDTAAYLTGRAWGKRKAWPKISPNKTVVGSIGGMTAGAFMGITALHLFPHWGGPSLPVISALLLSAVLGAATQAGDLIESALKRWAGVKDSGVLIPGHGGVLDRFDSLLLSFPTMYYLWYYFLNW